MAINCEICEKVMDPDEQQAGDTTCNECFDRVITNLQNRQNRLSTVDNTLV